MRILPFRDPRSIPNMTLWLDASDTGTMFDATTGGSLPADAGAVARWVDKGPSAFSFTQGTANNRPLRRAGNLHGLDGIQFDGSNDSLYAQANVFDTGVAVLAVLKLTSATARSPVIDLNNGSSGIGANAFLTVEANTYLTAGSRWGTFASNGSADSASSTSTNAACVMMTADATGGNSITANTNFRLNGVSSSMTLKAGGGTFYNMTATADRGVMLGSYNSNGTAAVAWGQFTLYELAVWNRRLTAAECQFLEAYVARKWGIAI